MTSIAFFTRLLDAASPAERLHLAAEQIRHAEQNGFTRAWVAQHHFHAHEGGLPSPWVFLAHLAAETQSIRLGTAVVTLTLEDPVRVAEDAVVADLLSDGRIDVGIGSGSTPSSFVPFGLDVQNKTQDFDRKLETLVAAFQGADLGDGNTLYPDAGTLGQRVWQATFSTAGGARAGRYGHGLLLSRTQPRSAEQPDAALHQLQVPIIEAYQEALPAGTHGEITASRTVFVADERSEALRLAEVGLRRFAKRSGHDEAAPIEDLIRATDTHVGTPQDVVESLSQDVTLEHADEVAIQVHSVDAPHELILRSIELFAGDVAPHFGWETAGPQATTTVTGATL